MNRDDVLRYVSETYGTEPEYPWADSPDAAVLRHGVHGKWYALLMEVSRSKLGLCRDGATDVLNVKCDPLLVDALVGTTGFCRAYHMNKVHWITVILEEAADEGQVRWMIDCSYRLTSDKANMPVVSQK